MKVTVDLTNEHDIQWLRAMSCEQKRTETIGHCITIGRLAMENFQVTVQDSGAVFRAEMEHHMKTALAGVGACVGESVESMAETRDLLSKQLALSNTTMYDALKAQNAMAEKLLDPIASRVDKLNETVEGLFNIKGTSNVKGKFGENFIAQHIQTVFPHYDVQNMSNTAYEADFQIGTEYGKVLLEVKTYSSSVNKEQLDKFYRDIDRTGVSFAIFLSTTSGIVGKKHIEWEVYGKEKTIVLFFPNSSLSQQGVVFSFLFMKALVEAEIHKDTATTFYKSESEVSALMDTFEVFYQKMAHVMEKNGKLRFDIGACKGHIDKMLDDLYKQSFDLELQHKAALEAMYGRLKDKLHLHGGGGGGLTLAAYQWLGDAAEFATWVRGLAGLKPAQSQSLHYLYDCIMVRAHPPSFKLCCDKTQPRLLIVKHDTVAATCHVSKTKIDVVFELSKEHLATPLTLHPMYESLKNNEITITLATSLTCECYALICRRLLVAPSPSLSSSPLDSTSTTSSSSSSSSSSDDPPTTSSHTEEEETRKKPTTLPTKKRKAAAAAAAAPAPAPAPGPGPGDDALSTYFLQPTLNAYFKIVGTVN